MTERKPPPKHVPGVLDRIGSAVDRVVCALSPARGIERLKSRAVHNAYLDRQARATYTEGGGHTETRDAKWIGSRLSPDAGLEQDLPTLRRRARELYLNDSIGGVVESRTNLVVSYGFTPQARIKERPGLITAAQAEKWNAELEEVYARVAPRVGKNGKTSLWQLSRLIERHHGVDGESFTILSDRGSADKPIPLVLEVVDPERVETPPEMTGNPRVRMGIEYDAKGQVVAYHIRDTHPGDSLGVTQTYTRYKAERVLHVYEQWFAGQSRGFPWLTRAMNRIKDAKDLDEAAIIAAQVEACMAAFVSPGMGGAGGSTAANNAATGTANGKRLQEIRPGMIYYGEEGEQFTFSNPTKTNGYEGLQTLNSRRISAAMAYPYEMVSNDWRGLSFAGGRLVLTNGKLFVQSQQELLVEMWFAPIWQRLVYESVTAGACSISPRQYLRAPWMFEAHEWNAPAWSYSINPGEEVNADLDEVNGNLATLASKIAARGGDYAEVMRQRQKEVAEQKAKGIEPAAATVPSATLAEQAQKQQQLQEAA